MFPAKKCMSNIGHWIQQWSCGDFWYNIGKVGNGIRLNANNVYQILGAVFSLGHVEMYGEILVNSVMELCRPQKYIYQISGTRFSMEVKY
jgi:hypothetical protein